MSVVEIVRFELADSADPERFTQVDADVGREHVSRQPGFISRETAQGEDDWVVIVHWTDTKSADDSMSTYEQTPAAAEQMSLMKPGTMTMTRYTVRLNL